MNASPRSGLPGRHAVAWLLVAACVVATITACEHPPLERARRHVYGPEFNYITDAQLQSSMWQLAAGVKALEEILGGEAPVSSAQRVDVIRTLEQMQRAANSLGPDGWPSNHPRITQHLGRFSKQLAAARRAAQVEPPSYYLAGSIAGGCRACH